VWTDQTVNLQIIDKYICSPTTGFELTLFIHCSYNSLAWCPAPNSILVISWSVYIGVALSNRIVTLFNIDTINDKVRHCFCGLFMTPTLVLFVITRVTSVDSWPGDYTSFVSIHHECTFQTSNVRYSVCDTFCVYAILIY
jgi:hypothetical protein